MTRFSLAGPCLAAVPLLASLSLPALAQAQVARSTPAAAGLMVMNTNISQAQVMQTQQAWCDALLSISRAYRSGGFSQARATAEKVLDQAYGYEYGPVAFKPTLTSGA